jgi:hypothetical protein
VRREGDEYVIEDGRTRERGARAANKLREEKGLPPVTVPFIVSEDDEVNATRAMVYLNEIRRTTDDDVTRAHKAAWLINQGQTTAEVAQDFKRSPATIKTWLRMLKAHPKVLEAVKAGTISASVAAEIATITPAAAQLAKLAELVAAGETSVRAARDNIRGERSAQAIGEALDADGDGEASGSSEDGEVADDLAFEDRVERALGGRPTLGMLKMMLAAADEHPNTVSTDVRNLLAWMCQKAKPNKVAGLTGLVRTVVKAQEEKRAKRVAAALAKAEAAADGEDEGAEAAE